MSRRSLKVAVGLVILAVVLIYGSMSGNRAAQAQGAQDSSAAQTIYPAGGSDGPPSP